MPHLMRAIAEEERLMPHFHLSAQSGDDMILKRMKRRHIRADTIAFCETVRRYRPEAAFGADLIAGFPTETEAMFENSLRLVDDAGLSPAACFSLFAPPRHAGRAHATTRPRARPRSAPQRLRAKGEAARDRRFWLHEGTRHIRAGGKTRLRPQPLFRASVTFDGDGCARQPRAAHHHRPQRRPVSRAYAA